MSGPWEKSPTRRLNAPREFLVSAEVYVSLTAGASLRKPVNQRKRIERRNSLNPVPLGEDERKLRDKGGRNVFSRNPTGHWREATCKLSEDGERSLLNVYLDETLLYQTIYVHLLNHTDIRTVDNSLFFRKNCLGIFCATGQRWSSTQIAEPVYLQFPSGEVCNSWIALLRSYAIPEVYGRSLFLTDGGSYRMWRQVELTIIQGRNLGNAKLFSETSTSTNAQAEAAGLDAVDLDVSCEIHINEMVCGRTTVKKGIGSPDWHETFSFHDFPPLEKLHVVVWREKRLLKAAVMGSICIMLGNFRRGEAVEGWFPILNSGPVDAGIQVGDIRLKLRIDEEIILPYKAYVNLLHTFNSRNFLDWMIDLEGKLRLKTISTQLMSIAVVKNVLIEQVFELADREVDGTPSSHNTLFRGNTTLTKIMELCMVWYGKTFLEASVGSVLRRLCAEKVAIEVDPVRSGKSAREMEKGVEQLIYWCQEFWKQIYSARKTCPDEMRRLFEHIRELVSQRYPIGESAPDRNRNLPWQSVSAFCFLRFMVPAILHPHLFGLCPGLPPLPVRRSLTLIAKVIQSLANLNANVQKEDFMRGVKDFLQDSVPAMQDYILVVSTPASDPDGLYANVASKHDRLNILNALRQRGASMPLLDREAIPLLPHLLDLPRHLAIITSAVIRNARDFHQRYTPQDPVDGFLDDFCARCFEVEERALQRVSQLAATSRRPSVQRENTQGESAPSQLSPLHTMPAFGEHQARQTITLSNTPMHPPRKFASPFVSSAGSRSEFYDASILSSPMSTFAAQAGLSMSESQPPFGQALSPADQDARDKGTAMRENSHFPLVRSRSTDSIPSAGVSGNIESDISDDAVKRKKGLLRIMLARR